MDEYTKYQLEKAWDRAKPWVWAGAALVAIGVGLYYVSNLGPKRVRTSNASEIRAVDDPAVQRVIEEVAALEKKYRAAADVNMVGPDAVSALVEAVEKQRKLLADFPRISPEQGILLNRLEGELDTARARQTVALIEQLDRAGEEALAALRIKEAEEKFREALRLQREINGSSAAQRYKNYVRETSLVQNIAGLEAEPLKQEVDAALTAARLAVKEERWGDALAAYTAARDVQARINREYSRTRYADLAAADRLDAEIESLNAAGVASSIASKEKAGDAAVAAGRHRDAAGLFAESQQLQIEVNRSFSRSRFVSSSKIEELEIKRQTALSMEPAETLAVMEKEIAQHLLKRQVIAAEQKIPVAAELAEKLANDFPKSKRLDGALKLKLAFLSLRRSDLRTLQDEVYAGLLPLPGVTEWLLLKTEVPQSLYVLVMNTNPSRNPGRTLPVDSVNWVDAQEFCTRLSWLLGTQVRLPTQDEFRVALSEGELGAWTKENSNARSQDVAKQQPNSAGYYDLLGNLAEWVAADGKGDRAVVIGGSYLDAAAEVVKIPTELRFKVDRARHIGFRFMVELPSASR